MRLPLSFLAPAVAAILAVGAAGCLIVTKPQTQAAPGTILYKNLSLPVIKGANAFGSGSGPLRGILYFVDQGSKIPDLNSVTPNGALYVSQLDVPRQAFAGGFAGITDRTPWF